MSRSVVVLLLVAFALMLTALAACETPEELRAADEAACTSFGFKAGTPDFAACLQRESLWRRYGTTFPGWYGPAWYGPGWYPPPPGMM